MDEIMHDKDVKNFWMDWLYKSETERPKHLEPIADIIIREVKGLDKDKELQKIGVSSLLNSYIEDAVMILG